jgi:hypothetical protein
VAADEKGNIYGAEVGPRRLMKYVLKKIGSYSKSQNLEEHMRRILIAAALVAPASAGGSSPVAYRPPDWPMDIRISTASGRR